MTTTILLGPRVKTTAQLCFHGTAEELERKMGQANNGKPMKQWMRIKMVQATPLQGFEVSLPDGRVDYLGPTFAKWLLGIYGFSPDYLKSPGSEVVIELSQPRFTPSKPSPNRPSSELEKMNNPGKAGEK